MSSTRVFHFSLGNSTNGPVGYCANVVADSRPAAVKRLAGLLPPAWDTDEQWDLTPEQMDSEHEYIAVYFNGQSPELTVDRIDYVSHASGELCCSACGALDALGWHFVDCTDLVEGDMVMPIGTRLEPVELEPSPYDPAFEAVYRITQAPVSYDGFGTHTVEWLHWRWKGGNQFRRVAIRAEHLNWQWSRYGGGLYVAYEEQELAERAEFLEPIPAAAIAVEAE